MRIVLIILSLSALAFIVSILYMLTNKEDTLSGNTLSQTENMSISSNSLALELLKNSYKQTEEINALKQKIEALESGRGITSVTTSQEDGTQTESHSGEVVPISAKFLSRIMPTVELTLVPNSGIFDLKIFDINTVYSTYTDDKFGMTVVASMVPYETFLQNFQAIDKDVYTVNPTTTFPFEWFYVNPAKTDATARLVLKVEAQTLLLTLPKSKFDTFKTLMLQPK